jgi:pilus assembly protein CpaC
VKTVGKPRGRLTRCLLLLPVAAGASSLAQLGHPIAKARALDSPTAYVARTRMAINESGSGEVLHVIVGHSTILRAVSPMRRIYVGNPSVLQTFTSSPKEVVVTAKSAGISSLVVWDTLGQSCLYTVSADVDPSGLRRSLEENFPGSNILSESREGRIQLSGSVPTVEASESAAKLASVYSKDVVNALRVVPIHGKQVQLKLRILEVDRTKMEQYGFNFFSGGKVPTSVSTQQFNVSNSIDSTGTGGTVTVSDPLNIFLYSQALKAGVTVKDLEQKQILQVLAEPTLTAMSGQTAKFLSGGEFPFPVVQGGSAAATAITIMFRPYGVKVDFTPVVNEDGSIRLKVNPEVSTLDYSNGVTISGFAIPALSTRRAETEIELRSGQSFVVSGLLDHRTTESLSRLPGISSIPILGQFFRSKNYNHSVVELVVMVTATVVDPLNDVTQPVEPKWVVPNMESESFDSQIKKMQNVNKKP